jgi:bacteriocin biosynthesis cyclodehydratase domain-containing protein
MKNPLERRLQLALPFTVVTEPDTVRLIAGEDFRYTLSAPRLERWLPDLLRCLDGKLTLAACLDRCAEANRPGFQALIDRLCGERIVIEAPATKAHAAARYHAVVEGSGPLVTLLKQRLPSTGEYPVGLLCQDSLDYHEALRFNRRCLDLTVPSNGDPGQHPVPWLWVTTGPISRGYVSPVFLPDAGPCLECLLRHFERLSPAPEIYRSLQEHAASGGEIRTGSMPTEALSMLVELAAWKLAQLAESEAPAALYRLHVLEVSSMEVTSHRVFRDPGCPACSTRQ